MKRKLLRLVLISMAAACAHGQAGSSNAAGSCPGTRCPLTLMAAERAFARDASVRTVNEAFLAVFGEHMTLFRPTPIDGRVALAQRPYPATMSLKWTPTYAETSADGTFGFDTGPAEFGQRGQAASGTGYFISVWRLVHDVWKLETDCGISGPIPAPPDSASNAITTRVSTRSFTDRTSLIEVDRTLASDYKASFARYADVDVRVYRDGFAPTTTIPQGVALIASDTLGEVSIHRVGVAGSGDLGYVVGVVGVGSKSPHGYQRIYRRGSDGSWKIAIDWRN